MDRSRPGARPVRRVAIKLISREGQHALSAVRVGSAGLARTAPRASPGDEGGESRIGRRERDGCEAVHVVYDGERCWLSLC